MTTNIKDRDLPIEMLVEQGVESLNFREATAMGDAIEQALRAMAAYHGGMNPSQRRLAVLLQHLRIQQATTFKQENR